MYIDYLCAQHLVSVSGGALGAVCLICLSAVVLGVFWKIYKRSGTYN